MKTPARAGRRGREGQTLIFTAMVLVIVAFAALWLFDLNKTLLVKSKSRNGGDAAALAAARWQGTSLNLIGNLNVLQAVALSQSLSQGDTNFVEARALADLQARLAFVGPMVGLLAAQQAAKNNGLYINADFTRRLAEHAGEVSQEYLNRYPVEPYLNVPAPPGAWDDYAGMLGEVAALGVAAAPDNMKLYSDYSSWEHPLLNPSFYDAVSTRDWCWFFFNAYALLQSYQSWRDWPALPVIVEPEPVNSEVFGLGLRKVDRLDQLPLLTAGADANTLAELQQLLNEEAGLILHTGVVSVAATWFFYRDDVWSSWNDLIGLDFPFRSDVRPEYDYAGADAAVRIETVADRVTPGVVSDAITWSAAAKPFGFLEGPVRPNQYGLVLPAFREIRLVPIDASSAPAPGSRPGWAAHVYDHVPAYVQLGLPALSGGCWYCAQLKSWEDPDFRQEGLEWLQQNSSSCRRPGPGSGPGGGSRRGH